MSLEQEHNPFEELHAIIRRMIWACTIFGLIISIIAISGVSLAWYGLRNQVHDNQELLTALCRQNNAQNQDLRTLLLSFGATPQELFELRPIVCDKEGITERTE